MSILTPVLKTFVAYDVGKAKRCMSCVQKKSPCIGFKQFDSFLLVWWDLNSTILSFNRQTIFSEHTDYWE